MGGGGKETPRQKMIGVMYLFLTCMLALNVSTSVLKSFLIVNDSIVATNRNFELKVESTYAMFERALVENKEKVQANYDKAQEARRLTEELRATITRTKDELVAMATGLPLDSASNLSPRDISRQDDYDTPSRFFILEGRGAVLKDIIAKYMDDMLALLPNDEARSHIILPFDLVGPFFDAQGMEIPWEFANFNRAIIVAAITILNGLQNAAMNMEIDIVSELFKLVSAGDISFDNVVARIIPRSTFVALGEPFEAEIFLVAFDSRAKVTANVNGQHLASRDGIVNFTSPTSREGTFQVSGWLDLPGGDRYPFKTEYTVAAPSASVAADKMNVFYVGVDNPVSLAVGGVDPSMVSPRISGAGNTITRNPSGPGYIVRVSAASNNVGVTLSAGGKDFGPFNFRAKNIPDPIVLANGIGEHETNVERGSLAAAGGLVARMKDFDFDLTVPVVSFTMTTTVSGDLQEQKATNNRFTPQMVTMINNARRGQRISFEDIVVRMPNGNRTVRNFTLTIR
jgi:gliding motility-associated protein GldM